MTMVWMFQSTHPMQGVTMVWMKRFELSRCKATDFKSAVSTDSTTSR